MYYHNIEKFRVWLIENLKPKFAQFVKEYDDIFAEWLNEVETSVNNGYCTVEIPHNNTISGNPETYKFDVAYFVNEYGEYICNVTF